nr:hypothetical protein [Janibacter limosus]
MSTPTRGAPAGGVAGGRVEGGGLLALEDSPLGQRCRRLEAFAGEQQGVTEEGVELREVGRAPFGEVAVGLRGSARRDGRELHERGVRLPGAAEDDERGGRGAQLVEALPQPLRAAEVTDHHDVGARDARGDLLSGQASGVGDDVSRRPAARAQQIGVGGGQQGDGRHVVGSLSGVPRPAVERDPSVRPGRPTRRV